MVKKFNRRPTLAEKTRELLQNRRRTLTIAEISYRLGVSENWVSLFATGKISDPSVNTIQDLYELLTGQHLEY
jgi:transcriptional regulator with XRE-family HTH domain